MHLTLGSVPGNGTEFSHRQRPSLSFPGTLLTAQELIYFMGLSCHHQIDRACERGEYTRLDRGVFMIAGKELTREAALAFCARHYPYLHVGGKTALIWRGLLPSDGTDEPLRAFGMTGSRPPAWVTEKFPVRFTSRSPFTLELPRDFGLEKLPHMPDGPLVSVPERALIEMLDDEGKEGGGLTLEVLSAVMSEMGNLRPEVLGPLLKNSHRPRVVRMCVVWAERLQFPWLGAAMAAAPKKIRYRPNSLQVPGEDGKTHWVTPPNSSFIIRQTNKLANQFLSEMGFQVRENYRFDRAEEPREVLAWKLACAAQKALASVNVEQLVATHEAKNRRKYADHARWSRKREESSPVIS